MARPTLIIYLNPDEDRRFLSLMLVMEKRDPFQGIERRPGAISMIL
jgi:hypothetical protein